MEINQFVAAVQTGAEEPIDLGWLVVNLGNLYTEFDAGQHFAAAERTGVAEPIDLG